jgi:hypothetical protein
MGHPRVRAGSVVSSRTAWHKINTLRNIPIFDLDPSAQGQRIGLVANVPVGHPGDLTEAGDRASFRRDCNRRRLHLRAKGRDDRRERAREEDSCFHVRKTSC